jgi:uncharacterized membrane protein YeaQ/YmgE (transglycosylase-associated protein family)
MVLEPGGLIAWLVVGLVAGWLAGQFMRGGGYGLLGDIVVGILGAILGGLLFGLLLPGTAVGLLGSIVVAFVGAVILIVLARLHGMVVDRGGLPNRASPPRSTTLSSMD